MRHDDISAMQEQLGIKTTLISAGRFKTELNPWEPLSEEAKAAAQEKVDEIYAMFVADVAAGRGTSERLVRDGYGQGRMLLADDAVAAGMADRVATLEETVMRLARGNRDGGASADDVTPPTNASGTPAANPPEGGEEPTARPTTSTYLDIRYAPPA
jgi:ClpP class serine protease